MAEAPSPAIKEADKCPRSWETVFGARPLGQSMTTYSNTRSEGTGRCSMAATVGANALLYNNCASPHLLPVLPSLERSMQYAVQYLWLSDSAEAVISQDLALLANSRRTPRLHRGDCILYTNTVHGSYSWKGVRSKGCGPSSGSSIVRIW